MYSMKRILLLSGFTLDEIVFRGSTVYRVGGPPHYIGKILRGLDIKLYIISTVGRDFPRSYLDKYCRDNIECILDYVDLNNIKFTNIIDGDRRVQYVMGGGYELSLSYLDSVGKLDYIIVSPVFNEIRVNMIKSILEYGDVALDPQGLLRRSLDDGRVYLNSIPLDHLDGISILKPSIEEYLTLVGEYKDPSNLMKYIKSHTIVTDGIRGSYLIYDKIYHIPSRPIYDVDSTGAGDMFLGYTVYSLVNGLDPIKSTLYSSIAVSQMLEKGSTDIEAIKQIYSLLRNKIRVLGVEEFKEVLKRR
ncbi:hypothetical protein DRN84_03325 [Candidatus Geothermarchaeota archaeon]|nr:MAG: hypothetical protein DRN84_03325 [Candidatus Geothermarchaeota archaeon]